MKFSSQGILGYTRTLPPAKAALESHSLNGVHQKGEWFENIKMATVLRKDQRWTREYPVEIQKQ